MPAKLSDHALHAVLLLNRIALGLFFLLAGVAKVRGGVGEFVEKGFRGLQPDWLPNVIATPYAYSIPYLEIVLGATLMLGLLGRLSALLIAGMIASFTVALVVKSGSFEHGSGPFSPNFLMIALGLLLTMTGAGRFSIDALMGRRFDLCVSVGGGKG